MVVYREVEIYFLAGAACTKVDTQAKDRKGGVTTKSWSSLDVIVTVDKEPWKARFARSRFARGLQHFSLYITLLKHNVVECIECQVNTTYFKVQ